MAYSTIVGVQQQRLFKRKVVKVPTYKFGDSQKT
jgi:hypothetical protein